MVYLVIITVALLVVSFIKDRQKTVEGLRIAWKRFIGIFIPLMVVLIIVSIVLFFIPESTITDSLSGENNILATLFASIFGSITMMPGFIAFPLCGILRQNGVPFMVLSAFTTTLMMVGVLTFPIEKRYFGVKVAILRNIISFLIALTVAIITGIFFGELF